MSAIVLAFGFGAYLTSSLGSSSNRGDSALLLKFHAPLECMTESKDPVAPTLLDQIPIAKLVLFAGRASSSDENSTVV